MDLQAAIEEKLRTSADGQPSGEPPVAERLQKLQEMREKLSGGARRQLASSEKV